MHSFSLSEPNFDMHPRISEDSCLRGDFVIRCRKSKRKSGSFHWEERSTKRKTGGKKITERERDRHPEEETRDGPKEREQHKDLTDTEPERSIVLGGLTLPSLSHVVGHTKLQPWQRRRVLFLQPTAVSVMTFKKGVLRWMAKKPPTNSWWV